MKLKNKISGEIKEFVLFDGNELQSGVTLESLTEEWEDYEEPKEYWYVSCDGRALKATTDEDDYNEKHNSGHKSIGNYFETQEEAEKAVEKLKAWKRLKDKGLKITGYSEYAYDTKSTHHIDIALDYARDEDRKDLDLLFGGEE